MFKIYTIYHETTFNDVSQKQVLSYIEQQRDSQQQWQHSRCCLGSSTNWHWGNIQQGKLSHWVHTASWQPSSPASAWQQKDNQQRWQHSRHCQGRSTSWHWDSIQQGRKSHWVHIVPISEVSFGWHLPRQGKLRQQALSWWKDLTVLPM